uniref:N_BRCA1_IG domain-containing protein n=1 Tax=Parastrongyloides trichosuri TaxID=131310 RepID=A0A0N4Z067_PARTI
MPYELSDITLDQEQTEKINLFLSICNVASPSCREYALLYLNYNHWNMEEAIKLFLHIQENGVGNRKNFLFNNVDGYYYPALPEMTVLQETTIGLGEGVSPGAKVSKTFEIGNTGIIPWPLNCTLRYVEGDNYAENAIISIKPLRPAEKESVSIAFVVPNAPGTVIISRWRLFDSNTGMPFGDSIWCIIGIETNGIMDLTQMIADLELKRKGQ